SKEVALLKKQLKELKEKYQEMAIQIDEFSNSNDPHTILNLKTQRIYDLQDEIKRLRKKLDDDPEIKRIKDSMKKFEKKVVDLTEQNEKLLEDKIKLDQERESLIYYYNDLKQKYEQLYALIQERDKVIADLQQRLQ
ncbi:MAG: hypothetical protein ACTSUE_19995, partial [Promethearchaeota archaeon]